MLKSKDKHENITKIFFLPLFINTPATNDPIPAPNTTVTAIAVVYAFFVVSSFHPN